MARKTVVKNPKSGEAVLPIALLFSYDRRGVSGMLRGIGRYARECGNWALVSISPSAKPLEALSSLKPAGIIVGNCCPGLAGILRTIARPVVNVSLAWVNAHVPHVTYDDSSIGSMAAEHLLECGLRNFGYFGSTWDGPTSGREGGFRQTLQRLSYTASVCYIRPPKPNPIGGTFASQKYVRQWIHQLPKPAGIFAPSDTWALWLCGVCKQESIKVPEEVAIIGVDNDELLCELSQPPLSSVAVPAERIGYEAASLLGRMINRKPMPDEPILLPATRVVTRQSTNILGGMESGISTAVKFIREHISEPIAIEDVLQHVRLSRRSFEQKFREALGRSPAQEIRRMRIEMAKTLLSSTRMKMESIARQCGFPRRARFSAIFHQATGMTPAEYRCTMGQRGTSHTHPVSH